MQTGKQKWVANTAVFIIGQAVSMFGSMLVQYAITWHITLTTQSGVYATIGILCGFVPNLLISPLAGVWADRYNRKLLMIFSDAFIALCTLVVALIFMWGGGSLTLLFVALVLRSLGSAVQSPCVGAMLPDLVPTEHLTRVNGIHGGVQPLLMLAAPVISGALMGLMPLEGIFFIDVITAAIAILILLLFLKVPYKKTEDKKKSSYFTDLKLGLRYIKTQKYLQHMLVFSALFNFFAAAPAFLSPLLVTRVFGDNVWLLTAVEMAFALGMIAGSLLVAAWGGFKNRVHTFLVATIIMGIATFSYGFPYYLWLFLLAGGVIGLMIPFYNTPAMVILQERVDPDYMGRVFSVLMMISSSAMPLGMLAFGPLADRLNIEILMMIAGCVSFIFSPLLLVSKPLMEAGKRLVPAAERLPEKE